MTAHQHADEIARNARAWRDRPLLREIYAGFYERIAAAIGPGAGAVIELGSGIGNLRGAVGEAILTDVFVHDWLDVACSAYRLPFRDGAARAIVLFDVFHHLRRPVAALDECARVLADGGRVIIFDVFVSLTSFPVYEIHPERVKWRAPIDLSPEAPESDDYYAAQGNATRMFFRGNDVGRALARRDGLKPVLHMVRAEAFSAWHYLLSGGFSKPALYPRRALPLLRWLDARLSAAPRLFGGRCLVVLEKR
ncbi:MAG: methyltransferase domain-containing protein [Acidobacteriota bacterium]